VDNLDTIFIVATEIEVNNQKSIFDIPVFISGVGKINATYATCKAINSGYKNIINIGSCGSLSLKKGELVRIDSVYQDIDLTPLCEYGETIFEKNSSIIKINEISEFSCVTTDYFIDLKQKDKYSNFLLEMISKSSTFDMECFAIAKVCKKEKVNFKCFKWVSDGGESEQWVESCKIGFDKFKKMYKNELKKERI
jgi:adenosylhomocysteine nucleosidase